MTWSSKLYGSVGRALLTFANRVPLGERSVRVGADRLYVDSVDRYLAAMSWKLGFLEREEQGLIEREVKPGMVALDIGANIGLHTIGLARRVGAEGRVHAIEPDPGVFRLLALGVARARLSQVKLHNVAAADRSGPLRLYISQANRGDHRLAPAEETRASVEVNGVALDDLLADEPRIDFAKIDVQGAEVAVLHGLEKTLARSPKIGILVELCPVLLERAGAPIGEIFAILRAHGLTSHRIARDGGNVPIDEAAARAEAEAGTYVNVYFHAPR